MPSVTDSPTTFAASDTTKDSAAALLYGQGSIAVCLERLSFAFSAASDLIKDRGGANDFDGGGQDDFHPYSTLLDHYSASFLLASSPIKKIADPISSISEDSKHLTDLKALHRSASQKADLAKHKLSKKQKSKKKCRAEEGKVEKAVQEVVCLEEKARAEEAMVRAVRGRKMRVWMDAVFIGLGECARMGVIIGEGGKRIMDIRPDNKPLATSILSTTTTRLQGSAPSPPTPSAQTSPRQVFPPQYGGLPMIHESESSHSGSATTSSSMRTTRYTTLDTSVERLPSVSQSTISRPLSQIPTSPSSIQPSPSPSYLQPSQTPIPLFVPPPSPSPSSPAPSYTQPPLVVQEKGGQGGLGTGGRELYRSFPRPYESFGDAKLAG